jgi:hypothetical protein
VRSRASRIAFVSWDGQVGPCINLLLPVAGLTARWDHEGECSNVPVAGPAGEIVL